MPNSKELITKYDWGKLPAHLHFLCAPAEKYGDIQFDEKILHFFKKAKPSDLKALHEVADKAQQHSDEIETWIDKTPMTENIESRVVYFLFHLIITGYAINKL